MTWSTAAQALYTVLSDLAQKLNAVDTEMLRDTPSPLTNKDMISHNFLMQALPQIQRAPVLSEESNHSVNPYSGRSLTWLIDPIDGTTELIHATGEYCVCVALIENHKPRLAAILKLEPIEIHLAEHFSGSDNGQLYQAMGPEGLSAVSPANIKPDPTQKLRMITSRRTHPRLINKLSQLIPELDVHYLGSALKFVALAHSHADFYLRIGPTHEWDTAAGDFLARQVGFVTVDLNTFEPLTYNKSSLLNPSFLCTHISRLDDFKTIVEQLKNNT